MLTAGQLTRARRQAEALMVDSCVIKRLASTSTDPETGVVTPTYSTVYSGKCRVQQVPGISTARPRDVGEATVFLSSLMLQLPMSVTGVASDDLVTVTASVLDPDLPGRTFHVRQLGHKTHATSRRLQIEEVTG